MRVGSLNHLELTVNDLAKSRAFYDRLLPLLGYRLLFEEKDSFGYKAADGMKLFFAQARERSKFNRYRVGLHHLAFEAPDRAFIDGVHAKLVEQDVTILDPPAEYPQYET